MYNYLSSCSLGGESLAVAQSAYGVLWFKGKELNFVFGVLLSVSRVVSFIIIIIIIIMGVV